MLNYSTCSLPAPTGGEQRFSIPLLFALLIFIVVGCGGSDNGGKQNIPDAKREDSGTLPNQVKYKFYKRNTQGRKPKEGDLLTFQLLVQNHKDAELSNTRQNELPYEENYFIYKPYFKEVFSMVAEGDSLSFWINSDSLKGKQGYLETPKVPAGTTIKWTVKMLRIRTKEEIKRELKEKYSEIRKKDSLSIAKYIEDLKKKELRLELQVTDSGLRYYIKKPGKGKIPQLGDTVMVNYVEKSIEGNLYAKSDAPVEFIIGDTLPKGLDEGLTLMTEGSSSVFILPSELGYGENPHGDIPKNAILVYEIDMVKLKH